MCCEEFKRGNLLHPLEMDSFFPVLQYADDTLILIKGTVEQTAIVKRMLKRFSDFTGLQINFNKSTFVPINMEQSTSQQVSELLECPVSTFPCNYLGLPLSTNKITHAMLMPVIHRVDKRLSGWLVTFLSWGGRLT